MLEKSMRKDIINMKNINKVYKMGDSIFTALSDVNLDIKSGEFVAIVGPL